MSRCSDTECHPSVVCRLILLRLLSLLKVVVIQIIIGVRAGFVLLESVALFANLITSIARSIDSKFVKKS